LVDAPESRSGRLSKAAAGAQSAVGFNIEGQLWKRTRSGATGRYGGAKNVE